MNGELTHSSGETQTNLMSVVNMRVPPCRNSVVLIRISQSTTQMAPVSDLITFSSCISLKYMSGVAYIQLLTYRSNFLQ